MPRDRELSDEHDFDYHAVLLISQKRLAIKWNSLSN